MADEGDAEKCMPNESTNEPSQIPTVIPLLRGGRIASPALRTAQSLSEQSWELEEDFKRYDLLRLVKQAGKLAGFSARMISLLDYYLAFLRDEDFEAGSHAIVYQSVTKTAMAMDVTERQIHKLERRLLEVGAIGFYDSGNHKRYGERCRETGKLLYAFGVDLAPLLHLREDLLAKIQQKRLADEVWLATKRAISAERRQIRAQLAEWELKEESNGKLIANYLVRYEQISIKIRTSLPIEKLKELLSLHVALQSEILDRMGLGSEEDQQLAEEASLLKGTSKGSTREDLSDDHYQYSNQELIDSCSPRDVCFQESVAERSGLSVSELSRLQDAKKAAGQRAEIETTKLSPPSTGIEHITLGMVMGAASPRFKYLLPKEPEWGTVVEAAYQLRSALDISQASWGEACQVLGRSGAAVALLVTDRASSREVNRVRSSPAYFRSLVRRAEEGRLRLHSTLFGLLSQSFQSEREEGNENIS